MNVLRASDLWTFSYIPLIQKAIPFHFIYKRSIHNTVTYNACMLVFKKVAWIIDVCNWPDKLAITSWHGYGLQNGSLCVVVWWWAGRLHTSVTNSGFTEGQLELMGNEKRRWTRVFISAIHDDIIKWKYFPHYWPFVWGIHRSPVNSPHKGQWHGALMFSLICTWTNSWVNNWDASDLRCHHVHYDVTVMHKTLWNKNITVYLFYLIQPL